MTLSAYIKTINAKGTLALGLFAHYGQVRQPAAAWKTSLTLPENTDWKRLVITGDDKNINHAIARFAVESGTVFVDDVQIEIGSQATAFNLRPAEWLRLEFAGYESNDPTLQRKNQRDLFYNPQYKGLMYDGLMPKLIQGEVATQTLKIYNDSRVPLQGNARITFGPWDDVTKNEIAKLNVAKLQPGQPQSFPLEVKTLQCEAYVAAVSVESQGKMLFDGKKEFYANALSGGIASSSILGSRQAIRFAVIGKPDPLKTFGVGNAMLLWGGTAYGPLSGAPLRDLRIARELGLTSARILWSTDDVGFLMAAGRLTTHSLHYQVDEWPTNKKFANPAHPKSLDIYNPQGWEFFKQRARVMGRSFAADPLLAAVALHGESPYLNKGRLTPSVYADEDFRNWCKEKHGDLATLNKHWETNYTQWEQVEQIVSAKYLQEEKNRPRPKGAAAIDWLAVTGGLTKKVVKRMQENPGKAMDWQRWRTASVLRMYSTFRSEARKYDKKTLYGSHLAWPAFWPQMFMPFVREMDSTVLDMQYTSGFKKALGTPYEMIDGMEMAESTNPAKPIWGGEIYIQPTFPAEYSAMQNWGMLAHGMKNNLVFAWKPYSDHGTPQGTKDWEKPKSRPMWYIIDNDGTKLPQYAPYVRSVSEINAYHKQYDGHSIQRIQTDVALYVSADTNEYVTISTGNKPWVSPWQQARSVLSYALRHQGISVTYVDDLIRQRYKNSRFFAFSVFFLLAYDASLRT